MKLILMLLVLRLVFLAMMMSDKPAHNQKVTGEHCEKKDEEKIVAFNAKKRQHKYEQKRHQTANNHPNGITFHDS